MKTTMPTLDSLREKLQDIYHEARMNGYMIGAFDKGTEADRTTLAYALRDELEKFGYAGTIIWNQEKRRDILIRLGYNPPIDASTWGAKNADQV